MDIVSFCLKIVKAQTVLCLSDSQATAKYAQQIDKHEQSTPFEEREHSPLALICEKLAVIRESRTRTISPSMIYFQNSYAS